MLTQIRAENPWGAINDSLQMHLDDAIEDDLIQIRNIDGLEPVAASVNSSPYGAVDGEAYTGSSIGTRNIVFTLGLNPNWVDSTPNTLRRIVSTYFTPKRSTRLIFMSDDLDNVEITGVVEKVSPNIFSKDPEIQVSMICHYPHFVAVDPTVVTGVSTIEVDPVVVPYEGSVPSGFNLVVSKGSGSPSPRNIETVLGENPILNYISVEADLTTTKTFELNSTPLNKYVQNVDGVVITNLLSKVHDSPEEAMWGELLPGNNKFSVVTDRGAHPWTLTYYKRYGGL